MIDTITLNPTFDRHLYLEKFIPEGSNRALKEMVCAGGKGVNVSRVLEILGAENAAVAAVGEFGAEEYLHLVAKDNIDLHPLIVKNQRVRTNIVIHSINAPETGINTETFHLTPNQLKDIYTLVTKEMAEYTAFSGRLPKGLTKEDVMTFLKDIKNTNTRLSIDSSSLSISDLIEITPWFIKPNRHEVKALGFDVYDFKTAKTAGEKIHAEGISHVIISLDGDGGVYVGDEGSYIIEVPTIKNPISTVGAGDSTVAGFLTGMSKGEPIKETLTLAFACGTAACMTEATLPPRIEDIHSVTEKIRVISV